MGWALPMDDNQQLMPFRLFAEDCICFARVFLELSGLGVTRSGPRTLDLVAGQEQNMTVEEKNRNALKGSFWEVAF